MRQEWENVYGGAQRAAGNELRSRERRETLGVQFWRASAAAALTPSFTWNPECSQTSIVCAVSTSIEFAAHEQPEHGAIYRSTIQRLCGEICSIAVSWTRGPG